MRKIEKNHGLSPIQRLFNIFSLMIRDLYLRNRDRWIDHSVAKVICRDVTSLVVLQPLPIYYKGIARVVLNFNYSRL